MLLNYIGVKIKVIELGCVSLPNKRSVMNGL